MGESDFMSTHDLWLLKTMRKEPFKGNFATQRGIDAEPQIKALYEDLYLAGESMDSPVMEYAEWPVLSASLDGIRPGMVVEFKYPSRDKHGLAVSGVVPNTYRDQLQVQMLVAGVTRAHYVSYDGQDIAVVEVLADYSRQMTILEACKNFWVMVQEDIEPPKKYVEQESLDLEYLAKVYRKALRDKERAENILEDTKAMIDDLIKDDKASFYGFTFMRSVRKGSVDYAKIPELEGVNLEQYRKPDSKQFATIKEEK